jgi:hypothetical protein
MTPREESIATIKRLYPPDHNVVGKVLLSEIIANSWESLHDDILFVLAEACQKEYRIGAVRQTLDKINSYHEDILNRD